MSIYGLSPLGTAAGPFGGPGLISVLGVLVSRTNQIIVVWDSDPVNEKTARFDSASSFENYVLGVVDPLVIASDLTEFLPPGKKIATRVPKVMDATADPLDPRQTIIDLDASMERGVEYELMVFDRIMGVGKEVYSGPTEFQFDGVEAVRQVPSLTVESGTRDFASIVDSNTESGYRFDPNTDIGIDEGDILLFKRVFRRLLTERGAFTHLPNYGAGFRIKGLFRPSILQSMASEAAGQIRNEPDVLNAAVTLQPFDTPKGTLVRATISMQRRGQEPKRGFYDFAPQNQLQF